ncbi:MAG: NAD(P)H-dependent oxidoreductase [Pseudomonadota bacterium]
MTDAHRPANELVDPPIPTVPQLLKITASASPDTSTSTSLANTFVDRLLAEQPRLHVVERNLADGVPHINRDWVNANSTPVEKRSCHHREVLTLSNRLVDELLASDYLVFGVPIYNFSVPSVLKAWIDHVCRSRLTFRYGANGPEGLLIGKKAMIIFSSGGTKIGGDLDFASAYLRHVLGFIGITDVEFAAADRLVADREASLRRAHKRMDQVATEWAASLVASARV